MTRTEFLQRRKSGIGGSDVAAVLGISPWRSPLDVWYDKTECDSKAIISTAAPVGEDRALYWGAVHEDAIAKAYSAVTGRKVTRYNRLLQNPAAPWEIGDVDRLIVPDGHRAFNQRTGEVLTDRALECKTARYKSEEWGKEGTDEIPVWYYMQVQWYMRLMPMVNVFDVSVLFGGSDFQIFTVERNDDVIVKLGAAVAEFWRGNVEKRVPPAPRSIEDVQKLYPAANVQRITASVELEADVRELADATAKRKAAEKAEADVKFRVAAAMGAAELAELPDGTPLCTYKNTSRGGRLLTVKLKTA